MLFSPKTVLSQDGKFDGLKTGNTIVRVNVLCQQEPLHICWIILVALHTKGEWNDQLNTTRFLHNKLIDEYLAS